MTNKQALIGLIAILLISGFISVGDGDSFFGGAFKAAVFIGCAYVLVRVFETTARG
jgi:hypothetical protein